MGFTDQLDGPPTPRNFPSGFYGSARRSPHTPNPIPIVGVSDRVSFLCGPLLAVPFGKPLMAFLPFGSGLHGHVQVESTLCGRTHTEPKRKVTRFSRSKTFQMHMSKHSKWVLRISSKVPPQVVGCNQTRHFRNGKIETLAWARGVCVLVRHCLTMFGGQDACSLTTSCLPYRNHATSDSKGK